MSTAWALASTSPSAASTVTRGRVVGQEGSDGVTVTENQPASAAVTAYQSWSPSGVSAARVGVASASATVPVAVSSAPPSPAARSSGVEVPRSRAAAASTTPAP